MVHIFDVKLLDLRGVIAVITFSSVYMYQNIFINRILCVCLLTCMCASNLFISRWKKF